MKTDLKFAALFVAILLGVFAFVAMAGNPRKPSDQAIADGLHRQMSVPELEALLGEPVTLKDQSKGDPSRPYVFTYSTYVSDFQSYSVFSFFFDRQKRLKETLERHQSPTGESGLRIVPLK